MRGNGQLFFFFFSDRSWQNGFRKSRFFFSYLWKYQGFRVYQYAGRRLPWCRAFAKLREQRKDLFQKVHILSLNCCLQDFSNLNSDIQTQDSTALPCVSVDGNPEAEGRKGFCADFCGILKISQRCVVHHVTQMANYFTPEVCEKNMWISQNEEERTVIVAVASLKQFSTNSRTGVFERSWC